MKNSISQLDQAYEICRKETQKWAKTFYLGTLLLPVEKRKAIWAIYVWCRRTDEIMDSLEASTKSQDELAENLNAWEENTKNVFKGNIKSELDAVLLDTIEKYPQSIQPYLDMIDGQRMDLNKFRYKDFDELKLYCYRVAGTVGLMTQNVMGIDSAYTSAPWSAKPDPSEAAIALGIANQLTNILRDPQEDIEKFNYSEEKLLKGEINKQWKALMNFQLTRARDWFQKSEDGIKWLSSDARWPVWTSLRLYRGILDSIERLDYDVFNNRAFVKNSVKAFEIPISFLISRIK